MKAENTCNVINLTWLQRLGIKLFPSKYCELPEMEYTGDYVVSYTEIEVSFIDRIKLLFSGRCKTIVKTATEHTVGKTMSNSTFYVEPPKFLSLE
jgi:hypothetical protein